MPARSEVPAPSQMGNSATLMLILQVIAAAILAEEIPMRERSGIGSRCYGNGITAGFHHGISNDFNQWVTYGR